MKVLIKTIEIIDNFKIHGENFKVYVKIEKEENLDELFLYVTIKIESHENIIFKFDGYRNITFDFSKATIVEGDSLKKLTYLNEIKKIFEKLNKKYDIEINDFNKTRKINLTKNVAG